MNILRQFEGNIPVIYCFGLSVFKGLDHSLINIFHIAFNVKRYINMQLILAQNDEFTRRETVGVERLVNDHRINPINDCRCEEKNFVPHLLPAFLQKNKKMFSVGPSFLGDCHSVAPPSSKRLLSFP